MLTNNRMNTFQITAFMISTNQGSDLIIETAPAKVISDLQINSDSQRVAVLLVLDLTAAFDTVDRDILI